MSYKMTLVRIFKSYGIDYFALKIQIIKSHFLCNNRMKICHLFSVMYLSYNSITVFLHKWVRYLGATKVKTICELNFVCAHCLSPQTKCRFHFSK